MVVSEKKQPSEVDRATWGGEGPPPPFSSPGSLISLVTAHQGQCMPSPLDALQMCWDYTSGHSQLKQLGFEATAESSWMMEGFDGGEPGLVQALGLHPKYRKARLTWAWNPETLRQPSPPFSAGLVLHRLEDLPTGPGPAIGLTWVNLLGSSLSHELSTGQLHSATLGPKSNHSIQVRWGSSELGAGLCPREGADGREGRTGGD